MWQNNGIQGHGNFENGQGNYQLSYGGDDGFIPFSPGPQSQQYFQVQHLMPYTEIGDGYMSGDFQPEAGPYNNESFMQNQYVSSDDPVSIAKGLGLFMRVQWSKQYL